MGCSKSSKSTNPTANDPANFHVSASGVSFSPPNLTIHVGDTIRWTNPGTHTVTSGNGAADLSAGSLFNEPLNSGGTYSYVFEIAGVCGYLCIPHEAAGMKGSITVLARS